MKVSALLASLCLLSAFSAASAPPGSPVVLGRSYELRSETHHSAALDAVRWMFATSDPDVGYRESEAPDYEVRWAADTGG